MRPDYQLPPIDPRRIRRYILGLGLIIVFLLAAFESISFYVESLWFDSVGYSPVFWYRLRAEGAVFLIFAAATTLLLWLLFRLVMPPQSPVRRMRIGNEVIVVPSADSLRALVLPIAIVLGILFGLSFASDWNQYALLFNRAGGTDVVDPILGRSLSFYLFVLPV